MADIAHPFFNRRIGMIIVAGFLAFLPALAGRFVWDDEHLVRDNTAIRSLSNLPEVFASDVGAGSGEKYYFYRPLQTLSYSLDYRFWGLNPFGYHLTHILLHILTALAFYWLINLVLGDTFLAFWAAIFFAVHPIQSEAVAYISCRTDLLSGLFVMLALVFYVKEKTRPAVLFYLAAMFSRESSIVFILLVAVYHWVFGRLSRRRFMVMLVATAAWLAVRLTILAQPAFLAARSSALERLPAFLAALAGYVRLMLLPFPLHMEYGIRLFKFGDPQALAGGLVVILLAAVFFLARKDPGLKFALAWFCAGFLPFSNVVYPLNAYMAEHWLYLASGGFFMLVGLLFGRLGRPKKAAGLAGVLTILYAVTSFSQTRYWHDPLTLFEHTVKYAPDSSRVYNGLGASYETAGRLDEALVCYDKALRLGKTEREVFYNRGRLLARLGRFPQAEVAYRKAIQADPAYALAYHNLGVLIYTQKDKNEGVLLLRKALALDPAMAEGYNSLGVVYAQAGDYIGAVAMFKKALALRPDFSEAANNLAAAQKSK